MLVEVLVGAAAAAAAASPTNISKELSTRGRDSEELIVCTALNTNWLGPPQGTSKWTGLEEIGQGTSR